MKSENILKEKEYFLELLPLASTTVYKIGNLGKQQAHFLKFSMCSGKLTRLTFNRY